MYACSVSLAATHVIGLDANEVLKACEVRKRKERREGNGWARASEGRGGKGVRGEKNREEDTTIRS